MGYLDLSTIHDPSFGQTPPSDWGDQIDLNFKALRGKPRCRLHLSANQPIPHDEPTLLSWDVEDIDPHGLRDAGQPTRLVIPAGWGGDWRFTARVLWDASTGGVRRRAEFILNGALQLDEDESEPSAASGFATNKLETLWFPSPGDYLTVQVYQDEGGDLDAVSNGYAGCVVTAEFLAAGIG